MSQNTGRSCTSTLWWAAPLTAGGFPSAIEDDPLLTLAMPAAEQFPHAEERRLFYVALTRTRRSVLLLTLTNRESPFLLELIKQRQVALTTAHVNRSASPRALPGPRPS